MIVFCDFDGTITLRDSDSELFREVRELNVLQERYRTREIAAEEYWRQVTSRAEPISDGEFEKFFRTFPIDESFIPFVAFCREKNIPLYIISDGMEFYIHGIFSARGISGLPVFANHTTIAGGKIAVTFPFAREHCVGTSANCKCSHLLRLAPDDQSIVYIGNGTSDRCPAQRADIIFAKQRLAQFCEETNIPYHNFHSFNDVTAQLEKYLLRPRQYKRSAAEQKRKELWAME